MARAFAIVLRPYISASNGNSSFGYYYGEGDRNDAENFNLAALSGSADPFKKVVSKLALKWLERNGGEILSTIGNFQFSFHDNYGPSKAKFERVEQTEGMDGKIKIIIRETSPGSIGEAF